MPKQIQRTARLASIRVYPDIDLKLFGKHGANDATHPLAKHSGSVTGCEDNTPLAWEFPLQWSIWIF